MESNPKISIIIPVYNVAKYLRECLNSVTNQTLKDIEIICVNDGSTDESTTILEEYAQQDKRLVIINQANAGAGAARNRGLEISQGNYLSFLDSDDFFESVMLEKMYDRAQERDTDITICRCKRFNSITNTYEPMDWSIRSQYLPINDPFSYKDIPKYIFTFCIGWAWDKLYKASFIKNSKLFFQNIRTHNDTLFVHSSLAQAEKISIINDVLAYHRTHNTSLQQTREKSWDNFYLATIALRNRLQYIGIYKQTEQSFINYALNFWIGYVNTLTDSTNRELYNKLRNEFFKDLGIDKYRKDYFYNQNDYYIYHKIKRTPYFIYKNDPQLLLLISQFMDLYRKEGPKVAVDRAIKKLLRRK